MKLYLICNDSIILFFYLKKKSKHFIYQNIFPNIIFVVSSWDNFLWRSIISSNITTHPQAMKYGVKSIIWRCEYSIDFALLTKNVICQLKDPEHDHVK